MKIILDLYERRGRPFDRAIFKPSTSKPGRREIDYEAPAFASEEVVARTWVEGWTGATSERHTEILRPADGKLLARAVTVWCAVDTTSRRPRRVDPGLRERLIAR